MTTSWRSAAALSSLAFFCAFGGGINPSVAGTRWSRHLGGNAAEEGRAVSLAADGSIFVAGWTESVGAGGRDAYVAKLNRLGVVQFQRTYGGTGSDEATGIVALSDGGFAFSGVTSSGGAGASDGWIVRADASGAVVWSRTLGGSAADRLNAITLAPDGALVVCGTTQSAGAGNSDLLLARFGADGTVAWQKTIGSNITDEGLAIASNSAGSLAVAGSFGFNPSFGSGDAWVLRLDAGGNLLWQHSSPAGIVTSSNARGVAIDSSGAVTAIGVGAYVENEEQLLLKFSATGVTQFASSYSPDGIGAGTLVVNSDATIVSAGFKRNTFSLPIPTGWTFDAAGNATAARQFAPTAGLWDGELFGLRRDADGDYVAVGRQTGQLFVVRTAPDLSVASACARTDPPPHPSNSPAIETPTVVDASSSLSSNPLAVTSSAVNQTVRVVCDGDDNDGDGVPVGTDNCPSTYNPSQDNSDGDPAGNDCDCDAGNAATYPGAPESCDRLNNNCSDPLWPALPPSERNDDNDGFRVCEGDCNDNNPAVRPGAAELCNQVDDDCNNLVDDLAGDLDGDGDGDPGACDCAPHDGAVYHGAPQICDHKNNDCNSPVWPALVGSDQDVDQDGVSVCQGDCADNDDTRYPGATELCDNLDQDCDETADNDDIGVDSDNDGLRNACDNCRLVANSNQLDSDVDNVGNVCDNCPNVINTDQTDDDGDSLGSACDNCPFHSNSNQLDGDGDTIGTVCDNCAAIFNPDQADGDDDFAGNVCDNCATINNVNQRDTDNDGQGDSCDLNDRIVLFTTITRPRVNWQADPFYTRYNLYRGSLTVLRSTGIYTQAPGSNPYANRFCALTTSFADDTLNPAAGEAFYWLVTGKRSTTESSLADGDVASRNNSNPCP